MPKRTARRKRRFPSATPGTTPTWPHWRKAPIAQGRWNSTTFAPASSLTSWCFFRQPGRILKLPCGGPSASSRQRGVGRSPLATTPRCATCFFGTRFRGMKSSTCWRIWKSVSMPFDHFSWIHPLSSRIFSLARGVEAFPSSQSCSVTMDSWVLSPGSSKN